MILLSELLGQSAVSLEDAQQTGTVGAIALDGPRIVGVGLGDTTIDASSVRSFEGDVLTFDGGMPPVERSTSNPIGQRVLDVNGDALGTIADLEIGADGTVEQILLEGGQSLSGSRLRAIGNYAAIVGLPLAPPEAGTLPSAR